MEIRRHIEFWTLSGESLLTARFEINALDGQPAGRGLAEIVSTHCLGEREVHRDVHWITAKRGGALAAMAQAEELLQSCYQGYEKTLIEETIIPDPVLECAPGQKKDN